MKLEQSFTVPAPVDEVWSALIDVERIAPCLPGAQITGKDPDGSYKGTFTVKLGPTTASYNGSLQMEALDEAAHRATMSAKGTDRRGQGGATATIVSTMTQADGGTRVVVDTDFHITGRLARFGRSGMIQDISNRLMKDFAECLQATIQAPAPVAADGPTQTELAAGAAVTGTAAPGAEAPSGPAAPTGARPAPQPAKPVSAFSLMGSALLERVKRLGPVIVERAKPLPGLIGERVKALLAKRSKRGG